MRRSRFQFQSVRRTIFYWLLVSFVAVVSAADKQRIDFNFQIRPILSDRCFKCHGPDPKSRKAGLRLDLAEDARATRKKNGTIAIVPHAPEKSEVIRRIMSADSDEKMPPPDSHLQLSRAEVDLLRQWIAQGAKYESHWSFSPLRSTAIPKVDKSQRSWISNPIDSFVLTRLRRENLRPSPKATKETLIRRLSLDLTGLPPSLKQIDAFLSDSSPDAYEKLVDRLLASPAYGERMANDWLDLARYADTYGYQSDVERDMSPWRDWVIKAFNENLPYDKFITWQVAGDMLPNATEEQILATAFNRLHRQTNEGGSIEDEFRNEYVSDRVHTFGTAFLGLTFECARCHDHKYDPIKQRDYYSLSAFFNNIDESGLYSHFTRATPSPTMLLYRAGEKEKHMELKKQIAEKELELQKTGYAKPSFKTTSANFIPMPAASFNFENVAENKTSSSVGTSIGILSDAPQQIDGARGKALKFDGENGLVIKSVGNFTRPDPFSFSLWLKPTEKQDRAVVFHFSRSWTDAGSRGYELLLEKGCPSFALIHFWPGNAIRVRTTNALPLNEWTQLTISYDGSSRASGLHLYINGNAGVPEVVRDNLFKDITYRAQWGDADVDGIELRLASRFRDSGFKNGCVDEFQIFDRALTSLEVKALFMTPAPTQRDLSDFFLNRENTNYIATLAALKQLRKAENDFVNDIPEIMVMKEMQLRRPTFVLKRGAYDAPGDPVEPGTPGSIFVFPKNFPKNRLGLARWLTDPRNPLTARVVVNRIWKMHFGRGLVATPENFGSQGQLPTHPELLDWLARHFIESGWNVKKLHKLIATSATYCQASTASSEIMLLDPDNRLLARGPKHRLQAEEIRDSALAVSDLLSRQIGGPSVKPYQPAGLWEQSGLAKTYIQDQGEKLYRRSLYTFWRRTSPPPSMTTFDATSREVCTARRETTATPLQSLVLLNDPQFVESARVLAEQMWLEHRTDIEAQLRSTFRTILGREPEQREAAILQKLYDEQRIGFANNPTGAEKYLSIGEHLRNTQCPTIETAAMAVVANTLMNHDEFVMER